MHNKRPREFGANAMLGIWVMFGALLSIPITLPLGVGMVSGGLFVLALLFFWIASVVDLCRWFWRTLERMG